jgi:glycosyltransferase involved in cell wall biosynthesis
LRILTYTTLYPNAAQPSHGVFVENRLRRLVESGRVEARVVAPAPWFPSASSRFGQWAKFAETPARETRHGLDIAHPRYPVIPKVGMAAAPFLLYAWSRRAVRAALAEGRAQLIDAHYFYPDGVAAALLAREFGLPFVVTARGTDLNLIPQHAVPRRLIRWAAARASGLITVCQALKDSLVGLGVAPDRVTVLRNGVDLEQFRPQPREQARAALGLSRPTLLSVGGLIERKGNHVTIAALPELPEFELLLAGEGEERSALERQARSLGVADRVRFLGRIAHAELAGVYSAADALALASSREGWANVLLEAMACGTPVVATDIWGTPEVVREPAAGVLMAERSPAALAAAVRKLFADPPDRAATRAYAEGFGWEPTTEGQLALFDRILAAQPRQSAS